MEEPSMLYYCPYVDVKLWKDQDEIDLSDLKAIETLSDLIFMTFDEKQQQLWVFSYSKDNKLICFYKITDGIIDLNKNIFIERPNKFNFCKRIYDNKILYCIEERNYVVIDLISEERAVFIINDIDGRLPMRYSVEPIGFSDKNVVFWNGYYSIFEEKYYFLDSLKYLRFIPNEEKIIGLNNEGYIVIYNLNSKTFQNTNIKRKMFNYSKYGGDDLYFLEGNKLYFSKDINGLYRLVAIFLPIWYSRRQWYVYDLQDQSLSKLRAPHNKVILMGNLY